MICGLFIVVLVLAVSEGFIFGGRWVLLFVCFSTKKIYHGVIKNILFTKGEREDTQPT